MALPLQGPERPHRVGRQDQGADAACWAHLGSGHEEAT